MKVTVVDLRHKTKEIINALDRNETITLTYRGKDKGIILPIQEKDDSIESPANHPAFGMWKNHKESEDVEEYVRKLRKGRFDDL